MADNKEKRAESEDEDRDNRAANMPLME